MGRPRTGDTVELDGIAVEHPYRRHGIGTELLATFEARAASLGYERVTLGSAGGYVDEFYRRRGYTPQRILVRPELGEGVDEFRERGYAITEKSTDEDTKKIYLDVDGFDPELLDGVRETFEDPHAVYIVERRLEGSS